MTNKSCNRLSESDSCKIEQGLVRTRLHEIPDSKFLKFLNPLKNLGDPIPAFVEAHQTFFVRRKNEV